MEFMKNEDLKEEEIEPDPRLLEIGRRLRAYRKARGLPQGQLAKLIGAGIGTIYRVENGEQPLKGDQFQKIEGELKLPPGSLGYGPKIPDEFMLLERETFIALHERVNEMKELMDKRWLIESIANGEAPDPPEEEESDQDESVEGEEEKDEGGTSEDPAEDEPNA